MGLLSGFNSSAITNCALFPHDPVQMLAANIMVVPITTIILFVPPSNANMDPR